MLVTGTTTVRGGELCTLVEAAVGRNVAETYTGTRVLHASDFDKVNCPLEFPGHDDGDPVEAVRLYDITLGGNQQLVTVVLVLATVPGDGSVQGLCHTGKLGIGSSFCLYFYNICRKAENIHN
ncbi:hypothetical protein JZ751_018427 [Albula glossodonta]|uniref:Uncharacterized protein n=1 Tax=Albula glossodonta TaxID=121402 RepID=A0A8T2MUF5_9TELE|nr:hypothetical protein JZ751_018427 [Albula glossodonta]